MERKFPHSENPGHGRRGRQACPIRKEEPQGSCWGRWPERASRSPGRTATRVLSRLPYGRCTAGRAARPAAGQGHRESRALPSAAASPASGRSQVMRVSRRRWRRRGVQRAGRARADGDRPGRPERGSDSRQGAANVATTSPPDGARPDPAMARANPSRGRLDDLHRRADAARHRRARRTLPRWPGTGPSPPVDRVPDPGPAPIAHHPARVSQDAQVVRDGRLGDAMTCGDVTGAHGPARASWRRIREPDGVGGRLQEQDVRVRLDASPPHCIDKCILRQVSI